MNANAVLFGDVFSPRDVQALLNDGCATADEAATLLASPELTLRSLARLIRAAPDPTVRALVTAAAAAKRRARWHDQLFLMPPLYISNGDPKKGGCVDVCVYCPWRNGNVDPSRLLPPMTDDRIAEVVEKIMRWGYADVELVSATDPRLRNPAVVGSAVKAARSAGARHVGLNIFPLASEDDYARVTTGVDFSIVWQETYDPQIYRALHPFGPKSDYLYRLNAHDRALRAGISAVGIAFLGGVADWQFDALATIIHGRYLAETYGANLIFGMPRWKSNDAQLPAFARHYSDDEYAYVGALFSLAVPSGLPWFSTRENFDLSAAAAVGGGALFTLDCSTAVDGYDTERGEPQFPVHSRPYSEGEPWLRDRGFTPRNTLPW